GRALIGAIKLHVLVQIRSKTVTHMPNYSVRYRHPTGASSNVNGSPGPYPNLICQAWAEGLFTAQKCNRTGTNRTDSCANPEASSGRRTRRDLLAHPDDSWFWNSWLFQGQRFFSGRGPGIDVHNHAPD